MVVTLTKIAVLLFLVSKGVIVVEILSILSIDLGAFGVKTFSLS
jgi:hypothetical protein